MVNRLLFIAALISFVVIGLTPFKWQPPRTVENGASIDPDRVLSVPKPGIAWSSRSPRWLAPAIETNSIAIRLTLRSFSTNQKGPARIFTVSRDESSRNVTIAQENTDLVVRLRRGRFYNGMPEYIVPEIMADADWHDVELIVRPTSVIILWDNETVFEEPLTIDPLRYWNPSFRLVIGNELTGNRPWLGEISQAYVEVGSKSWNCLNSSELEMPSWYFSGLQRDYLIPSSDSSLRGDAFRDVSLNFICFIPLGYLLSKSDRHISVLSVVGLCATISLSVELAQLCFDHRYTSLIDLGVNSLGGGMGAVLAKYVKWRRI